MKAFNLLYGRRKRGPGPKPQPQPKDMSESYVERLEKLLLERGSGLVVGGINPKDYTLELESTTTTEIIVTLHNHRHGGSAVQITVEPFLYEDKPTFPLFCKIEPLVFDDDKGRWYVSNAKPGRAVVKDSSDLFIDCEYDADAGMTEIAMRGAIIPAIDEL